MAGHLAHGDVQGSRAVITVARRLVLRWSIRFASLLGLGAAITAIFLHEKGLNLFAVACSVPLFSLGYLYTEASRAEDRMFLALVFDRALRPILVTCGVFVLWYWCTAPDCTTVVWLLFATLLLTTGTQIYLFHSRAPAIPHVGGSISRPPTNASELLRVGVPLLLATGIALLMSQGGIVMVAMLAGDRGAALFGVASRMSIIASVSSQVVNNIALPRIAALHARGDLPGLRRTVGKFTHLIFWPAFACIVLIAAFSSSVLGIFGADYRHAQWPLIIMLCGQLVNTGCGLCSPLLQMTGYQNYVPRVLATSLVTNVVLDVVLVPRFGVVGAAIADACSLSVWNVWCVVLGRRHLRVDSSIFGAILAKRAARNA
ncbi:MAG: polysaccharide biosynthesis C-terminal domain-containing protein [Deltaproteobacteria bacterium]|nr:polysaccharide biosynthesis C-terminal domain-containing protein [Deltaproteobacteria bacterium]